MGKLNYLCFRRRVRTTAAAAIIIKITMTAPITYAQLIGLEEVGVGVAVGFGEVLVEAATAQMLLSYEPKYITPQMVAGEEQRFPPV